MSEHEQQPAGLSPELFAVAVATIVTAYNDPTKDSAWVSLQMLKADTYEEKRRAAIIEFSAAGAIEVADMAFTPEQAGLRALTGTYLRADRQATARSAFSFYVNLPYAGLSLDDQRTLAEAYRDELLLSKQSERWWEARRTVITILNGKLNEFHAADGRFSGGII